MHRVLLLVVFILCDSLFTLLPLGFFAPSFQFSIDDFVQNLILLNGYSFTKSPFDFVVLFLLRLGLLISAGLLIGFSKERFLKSLNLVILGLCIFSASYTIVKLLAFSEIDAQLKYPGVWLSFVWSFLSTSFFSLLWYFTLNKATLNYNRFFNPNEAREGNGEGTESELLVENEEDKADRLSTWHHIRKLMVFCFVQWRWLLSGFFFLILYSAGSISSSHP